VITPRKSAIPGAERSQLLTRREVALRFGVSPQTVTRWANEDIIPHVRTLGGQRRYPAYEVERLLGVLWEHGLPGSQPPFLQRESEAKEQQ